MPATYLAGETDARMGRNFAGYGSHP